MHYLNKDNVAELLKELSQYDASVLNINVLASCAVKIRTAVEELTYAPNPDTDTYANLIILKEYQKIYDKEFIEVRGGKLMNPYEVFAEQLKVSKAVVENSLRNFSEEELCTLVVALSSFPMKENPLYDDLRTLCYEIMEEYIYHIPYTLLLQTIAEYEIYADDFNGLKGMLNLLYKGLSSKIDSRGN